MPPERLNGTKGPSNADESSGASASQIAKAFARCFATVEGDAALRHLTDMTLRRALGPEASDAMLRHIEGQRQLVAYIHALIARGRAGT